MHRCCREQIDGGYQSGTPCSGQGPCGLQGVGESSETTPALEAQAQKSATQLIKCYKL